MAGLGEVKVSLGLDTSKAQSDLKAFFDGIGKQKAADPFKGLEQSFDKIEKGAKDLGLTWDNTLKKFKDSSGATQSVEQVATKLVQLGTNSKNASTSVKAAADAIKQAGDQAKGAGDKVKQAGQGFTDTGNKAKQAGGEIKSFGSLTQQTGNAIKGLQLGQVAGQIKKIGTDSKTAGDGIKGLGTSATNAGNALKNIGTAGGQNIKNLGTAATGSKGSVDNLSQSIKNIGSSFKTIPAKPLGQLGSSLTTAKTQSQGVATNFTQLGNAIATANSKSQPLTALPPKIKAIGTSAQTSKTQVTGLGNEFQKAGNQGNTFIGQIKDGFQSIANGIPQGIGLAIGQGLITPIKNLAGVIPAAVEEFRQLDESIRLTLGIAGASQSEFGTLSNSILAVSSASAATAAEVAGVAQSLAKAGFSMTEIDAALKGVIDGAEATGTAYETMGDIVVSALGAFGLAAQDASDVADTLVVAANNSNQSVTDLGEAIKYVGPVANSTGQSLQDVALALELLANNGIRGSQAGTSFRTILTNLQIAASGAGQEFKSLSRGSARLEKSLELIGANMTDANGELLTGKALILELQRAFDGLSAGETALVSKALAGAEGLPAMNALINASSDTIDELADKLDNRAGTAAQQAQAALSGLAGSFKLLESNVSAALVQIGAVIATALKPLIDALTGVLSFLNQLPGPIKNVLTVLGLLGAAIGATTIALKALAGTQIATFFTGLAANVANFGKALTAANIQNAIAGMVNGLKSLAATATGGLIKGLQGATKAIQGLSTALKGENLAKGFNTAISAISKGLKGIPAAGAAVQLDLFSTAAATAGTKVAATGTAAAASATGVAAAGTASAGAAAGVGALAASVGAFLVAAAPFIAIGAGIAATVLAIKDRFDAYKEVADPLVKSQEALDKSLRDVGEGAKVGGSGFTSWGKAIEDTLGPLDRFLSFAMPVYNVIKLIAEGLGKLNEWDRQRYQINAANDAYAKFQSSLEASNQKIAENRAAMAQLNPTSEEFGRLANENSTLINAQKSALEDRIAAIDSTIKSMEKDGTATEATRSKLQELKSEYQSQIGVINANVEAINNERRAYEDATGNIENFKQRLNEATKAREDAYAKADTQVIYAEAKARQAVTAELLTEKEAQAALAKATLDATDDKIDAVNQELAEIQAAYDQGGISQDEYVRRQGEAVEASKDLIKERVDAEKAAKDAVIAAIDDKMRKYEEEAQFIAKQVGRINQALSNITQVQSSGVSAFKTLAQEVTNFQIQGIDKAKDKQLKAYGEQEKRAGEALDREEKRRLAMIDASSASDEAKSRQRESLQKNFDSKRDALESKYNRKRENAEAEYARKRRSIMEKQIAFEKKALEAQIKLKEVELQLWYEQEKVATNLAIAQNAAAQVRAEAAGDDKLLQALKQEEGILRTQLGQLDDMRDLKGAVLKAEELIGKQQIATKADAEGIKGVYGGQVTTLGQVTSAMDALINKGDSLAGAYQPLKNALGEIPQDAKQRAAETVRAIENGLGEVSFESLKEAFIRDGIPPALAEAQARVLTEAFDKESKNAGSLAGRNILERFGDIIPKELIKQQLVDAFVQGSGLSVDQAEQRFANLPDKVPAQQVATILGNAIGGGAETGFKILAATPVPPGLFGELGAQIPTSIKAGTDAAKPELASLGTVAMASLNALTGNLPELIGEFGEFGTQAGGQIVTGFQQGIGPGFEAIGNAGIEAFKKIPEFLRNDALQDVVQGFVGVTGELIGWGGETGAQVSNAVNGSLLEGFTNTGQNVVSALSNIVPGVGPILVELESRFGLAGKTAGILFGEENVNELQAKAADVINTVGGWFGAPELVNKVRAGGAEAALQWVGEFESQVVPIIDKSATYVGQAFGDIIPKTEIAEDLRFALDDGTAQGMKNAEEQVNALPDFIPREEVARILGEGIDGGVKEGELLLNAISISDQTKKALGQSIEDGMGEGAKEGTDAVGDQVEQNKKTVSTAIQDSVTAGFNESSGEIKTWANQAGADISEGLGSAGSKAAETVRKAYEKELGTLKTKFSQLGKEIDVKGLGKPIKDALLGPIGEAATELGKLNLADGFEDSLSQAATAAEGVANSGIASELQNAARNGANPLKRDTQPIAGNISRAIGPANRLASALERAARAAARANAGRWAGGPVQGGQQYTVNELGREMFLSNTGSLSEIRAPKFGQWRAPTSGTVIPASISEQIRQGREASGAAAAINNTAPSVSPALRQANKDTGSSGNALVKAIKGLGGGTQQTVTNNVQITSSRPAVDASRVLTDLARLRAQRRRGR